MLLLWFAVNDQLTVHNVQITTARVEIKTLTVSGKEMTIAVFRQLIEAPLISEDGNLNGVPWGTVNHHSGKCDKDPPHWHVVWRLGDEMRRSQVSMAYEPESVFWSEALAHLHAASVYQWLATGQLPGPGSILDMFKIDDKQRSQWIHDHGPREFLSERGIKAGYRVPEQVSTALRAEFNLGSVRQTQGNMNRNAAKAEQDLEKAREDLSAATSRRGFRRSKAPVNHVSDCTCTECFRSDPAKAADRVRHAEEWLEKKNEEAGKYSPDSAKVQQAEAELRVALKQLRDRHATKSFATLRRAYSRELKAEVDRRKRKVDARKVIADLPQLFIGAGATR